MDQHKLIARWIRGEIPAKLLPWQIDLDLTNICNQSCFYCNSAEFRASKPVYQNIRAYLELVDKLAGWREHDANVIGTTSNVILSGGGEPTLLPGYEWVVERLVDRGFFVAMNTNGTKLDRLLNIAPEKLQRMAYIGLDIDSGNPETYEQIRRSLMTTSPFQKIKKTAQKLTAAGAPVDVKMLLLEPNTTPEEIHAIASYAQDIGARSIHFRPGVIDDVAFPITPSLRSKIQETCVKLGVDYHIAVGRYEPRSYLKCHQFFLFPSFCADGWVYLCCEYKGFEQFRLCKWIDDDIDWRDIWGSEQHRARYENFLTTQCKPCRPNTTNNRVELGLTTQGSEGFI